MKKCSEPAVSVIIPVYNVKTRLQDFVEAWKVAATPEEKSSAAKAIRERWLSYIKYYRFPKEKGDKKLVLKIILGIA